MRLYPPFIDNDVCPLTIKNTILQSCYLRNTEWACGVAIYTGKSMYYVLNFRTIFFFSKFEFVSGVLFSSGNETKLGMSRGIPEPKLTAMDAMIDKLTGAIFIFQIVVVLVLGIAGNVWKDTEARKVSHNLELNLLSNCVKSYTCQDLLSLFWNLCSAFHFILSFSCASMEGGCIPCNFFFVSSKTRLACLLLPLCST